MEKSNNFRIDALLADETHRANRDLSPGLSSDSPAGSPVSCRRADTRPAQDAHPSSNRDNPQAGTAEPPSHGTRLATPNVPCPYVPNVGFGWTSPCLRLLRLHTPYPVVPRPPEGGCHGRVSPPGTLDPCWNDDTTSSRLQLCGGYQAEMNLRPDTGGLLVGKGSFDHLTTTSKALNPTA
ncbi:unnamed protein product [Oncorhynchus mykiss]|uniref:Uncharacterized protein n=1 Tax=Oncorhynchus mykiss TaxID=8022 RepID=A0A060ZAV7_ONCMY|nr:unnamed protein product [Oncorhynchus mykiss]